MSSDRDAPEEPTDRQAPVAAPATERGPDLEQAETQPTSREEGSESPSPTTSEEGELRPQPQNSSVTPQNPSPPKALNPPLPDESVPSQAAPPLPNEPLPREAAPSDDGWEPVWDAGHQAFYFYNRLTSMTQWENPRVPEANAASAEGVEEIPEVALQLHGGYNPAIHGDYDPTAPYAQEAKAAEKRAVAAAQPPLPAVPGAEYAATGHFNRFTGRWQAAELTPDSYNDDAKSKSQMNAFFDVDAAANTHNGRSLKAERSGMKLTKTELKAFKEKRRERKEEKRRAWLRD